MRTDILDNYGNCMHMQYNPLRNLYRRCTLQLQFIKTLPEYVWSAIYLRNLLFSVMQLLYSILKTTVFDYS